jgi:hypothetical protein
LVDDASPSYRRRSSAPAPKSSRKVSEQKLRNIAELGKADAAAVERIIRGESKSRGRDGSDLSLNDRRVGDEEQADTPRGR